MRIRLSSSCGLFYPPALSTIVRPILFIPGSGPSFRTNIVRNSRRTISSTPQMYKHFQSGEVLPEKPTPVHSRHATFSGKDFVAVTEGLATVLFPKTESTTSGTGVDLPENVFYNPIQQFNRDMSVLAIKTFGEAFITEKRSKARRLPKRRSLATSPQAHTEREKLEPTAVRQDGLQAEDGVFESSGISPVDPTGALPREVPIEGECHGTPKFTVLDALSATGLRALRYTLEIPFITSATANDLDLSAINAIQQNIAYNLNHHIGTESEVLRTRENVSKIKVSHGNAQHHMYSVLSTSLTDLEGAKSAPLNRKYNVIDLDPYGTAAPFLDAAVQAVSDGGMLCVTCTDASIWASTGYSEKCFSLYGGLPAKADWSHEAGLRLILHAIATSAGRYGRSIEPLLSLSIDFYARLFVKIRRSPAEVKNLASTSMVVYNCDEGCGSWVEQRLGKMKELPNKTGKGTFVKYGLAKAPTAEGNCPQCGWTMHLAGPMWGGPLHSADFVDHFLSCLPDQSDSIYNTLPRITGMLQIVAQEASLNSHPFFHNTSRLSKALHCTAPPYAIVRGALIGLGYKVARSHCKSNSLKTNAPQEIVWEVMKKWVENNPLKGVIKENTAGYNLIQKPRNENLDIKLDESLGREELKAPGVVRYQINPTANWGPMGRAKGSRKPYSMVPDARDERAGKRARMGE